MFSALPWALCERLYEPVMPTTSAITGLLRLMLWRWPGEQGSLRLPTSPVSTTIR